MACGRLDFDALHDAAPDTQASVPSIVQTKAGRIMTSPTITLTVAPTAAGSLLVVASGGWKQGSAITSISDDAGNTYVSANAKSVLVAPNNDIVEIWYAGAAKPGATAILISAGQPQNRDAWFLEVSGIDPTTPLDVVATVNDAPTTLMPTSPPISPQSVPSLVVVAADFGNSLTGLATGSVFTALPIEDDNNAAYRVATTSGSEIATWVLTTPAGYCSSAATFRAAP
jgi:hypothetical protein